MLSKKGLQAFEKATKYFKQGLANKALVNTKKAIYYEPKLAEAHFLLADLSNIFGDYSQAILEYNITLKYKPTFLEAYNNLGVIYEKINNLNLAEQAFKKAIQINYRLIELHINLGIILIKQENYTAALRQGMFISNYDYAMGEAFYDAIINNDTKLVTIEIVPDLLLPLS